MVDDEAAESGEEDEEAVEEACEEDDSESMGTETASVDGSTEEVLMETSDADQALSVVQDVVTVKQRFNPHKIDSGKTLKTMLRKGVSTSHCI